MPLSLAVVGAGFMGSLHARTVAECDTAELAALVDLDETAGRRAAEEYGARWHRTVEDALEDPSIDAYIVALPDRLHVAATSTLLAAGKPVLLEKPMADTLDGARAIADAARRGGARLLVGQLLRFDPRYAQAAEAVRGGAAGDPVVAKAGRFAVRDIGTRTNGTSSVVFYLGIHDVDALQWVTGSRITRVYSRAVSRLMPSLGVDSEDAILSVVDFADGFVGQLFNGWVRPENSAFQIDGRLELIGTSGTVEVDVRDHGLQIGSSKGYALPDGNHWPDVNGRISGDLAAEVAHFVRALRRDEDFVISVDEAMSAVAVNDAILRSVGSGQAEDVEGL
ncbi:gfo/Idh/MocA family oxidoreductase [Streptomyces armeniacus]|uniref:Gfo/Idh/MocA family oxidoreductase n=1 Tax=Streptomyces armeniacus TaxID=83291 RepID=A0A345XS55_9ACTN|nr:Gfo/Idh/MocA family oxidoreductase [Streptomyces armeniacus]AXK34471.1 gfo/Idh/MocA family oxidoreductase [Streptomyces armeniacus]